MSFCPGSGVTRQLIIWRALGYHGNALYSLAHGLNGKWMITEWVHVCVCSEEMSIRSMCVSVCASAELLAGILWSSTKAKLVIETLRERGQTKIKSHVSGVRNNRFSTSDCGSENCLCAACACSCGGVCMTLRASNMRHLMRTRRQQKDGDTEKRKFVKWK